MLIICGLGISLHLHLQVILINVFQSQKRSIISSVKFSILLFGWNCKMDCFIDFSFLEFMIMNVKLQQIFVYWFVSCNITAFISSDFYFYFFLVEILGFSVYSIMSSVNVADFLFIQFALHFLSLFLFWLFVARTSNTLLNKVTWMYPSLVFLFLEEMLSAFHSWV